MRISPEPRISGLILGHLSKNPEFGANPEILGPVGTLHPSIHTCGVNDSRVFGFRGHIGRSFARSATYASSARGTRPQHRQQGLGDHLGCGHQARVGRGGGQCRPKG